MSNKATRMESPPRNLQSFSLPSKLGGKQISSRLLDRRGQKIGRALVIYAGSITGNMTGGEYAMSEIVDLLQTKFDVRLMLFDNWASKVRHRPIRHLLRTLVWSPATVLYSYLVYPKYDLIVTTWTPDFPYYGDICYIQPFAGSKDLFYNPEHDFTGVRVALRSVMKIPNRIVGRSSLARHLFVANSAFVRSKFSIKYPAESTVVYPPVPAWDSYDQSPKENLVLTIGRVVSSKNFQLIGRVGPSVPDAKFVLMGSRGTGGGDVISSIKAGFAERNLAENFSYEGWVPQNRKVSMLKKAKILFHPSINEPFGISIIEGMRNGAIPVAHNSGGPKEFVPSDWLFDDTSDAIRKIRRALELWTPEVADSISAFSMKFGETTFKRDFSSAIDIALMRKKKMLQNGPG